MIGILPFAIIIMIGVAALLAWACFKAIVAFQERRPIPIVPLLSLILALAIIATIARVAIALTIGLAHSRSPFEYTRTYGIACLVIIFILPTIIVLAYHLCARRSFKA